MKRFVLLIFVLNTFNLFGQNFNFDKSGGIIWQCVYKTDMQSSELHKSLHLSPYIHSIEKIDSTFYKARLKRSTIDYKSYGFNRMQLPIYLTNNDVVADVIIEYKEGKYRVTLKNIDLKTTTSMEYGTLNDIAIGEDGYFADHFINDAGNIYHNNFKKWFELESISNDW